MAEKTTTAEADTLDEARALARSRIAAGAFILSERTACDGTPQIKNPRTLTVAAETLAAAWEQVRAQTPAGFEVTDEQVLSSGSRGTRRATAPTDDLALAKARKDTPWGAVIQAERIVRPAVTKTIAIEAFDGAGASAAVDRQAQGATVAEIQRVSDGKRGFLGIGRTPHRYSATLRVREAQVEVDYLVKAEVRVTLGEVITRRPAVELRLVDDVAGLVEALDAIVRSPDGLAARDADRRPILDSLRRAQDERIPALLLEYVRRHQAHLTQSGFGAAEHRDLLILVLHTLEAIGGVSARSALVDLVCGAAPTFAQLYVPDLLGRHTSALRALVAAFVPITVSDKQGARDNDGYETWLRYDTEPLENALVALSASEDPVSTNLLHRLAALPAFLVPRGYSDRGDPGEEDPTERISLRQKATDALARRGHPPHDPSGYLVETI